MRSIHRTNKFWVCGRRAHCHKCVHQTDYSECVVIWQYGIVAILTLELILQPIITFKLFKSKRREEKKVYRDSERNSKLNIDEGRFKRNTRLVCGTIYDYVI